MNKGKSITGDLQLCEAIISKCPVCRLGMVEGDRPYVIPANFGYRNKTVYIHTGLSGRKLDVIARNPNVCVEFDTAHKLVEGAVSCKWTMHGESVVAEGSAELVKTAEEKRQALKIIMIHYGGEGNDIPDSALDAVAILRIRLTRMTAGRV